MKIALLGYGKMGREIERLSQDSDEFEVVSISYKHRDEGLDRESILKADVAIDFTSADSLMAHIEEVGRLGKNLVIGTTGWYDKIDEAKELVDKYQIGLVYGQNFSIGANIFFKIVEAGSKMLGQFSNLYDVYGFEIHHKAKKDSPSGTAKKISDIILQNFPSKKVVQNGKLDRQIESEELHFASVRGGVNPGLHEVIFDSMADEIRLTHAAHGRQGFAQGALMAARLIKDKKGFFSFDELFSKEINL